MDRKRLELFAFALSAAVVVYAVVNHPAAAIAAVAASFALMTDIITNF